MLGLEEDWSHLMEKLDKLEQILKPIENVLMLADWFKTCKKVLMKLYDTFQGNPDCNWWSRIMSLKQPHGSGAGTFRLICRST